MNLYPLLRPVLFSLSPETAHTVSLKLLDASYRLKITPWLYPTLADDPVNVMGLTFKNRVGLAAGLDKNGDYIDALAALGFGFIEIGTVTPRPQPGNPKPRLFRLPEYQAIINRMGFNNLGLTHLLNQVQDSHYQGILGINIGKNFDTPIDQAVNDYVHGLTHAYPYASYIAINISSPNTQNLRQLQQRDELQGLLATLKQTQHNLEHQHQRYVPLAVKIAPDLSDEQLHEIATMLLEHGIDGVIATNTTLDRSAIAAHPLAAETGGLSGAPLKPQATHVIRVLHDCLQDRLPIIAVGGITSPQDAQEKIDAGASLVQVYSGLIYQGPELARTLIQHFNRQHR
ncbi:quinone-dependent dihydroorotate dehydrogenase [Methylocucumis oryzae]|uniref:Dihydroorotate dehydrogenase (quinone) n=1 Tax=Methylocucumis oryzae TaxID=1632867 RepID=A0A0F3IFY0_9GAMM|nr:quinone-dependent dihydroorotate dehydrogenase [Methylocucumis oryzae]KJV05705.1 dihydroorotate dehydrogenase [Methylocucumis oryzae]